MKLQVKTAKIIEDSDWDQLVKETYKRPYCFQQQDGCRERGVFALSVPSDHTEDECDFDSIPEIVNGEDRCVKFAKWLERDPTSPLPNQTQEWELLTFWERNFYPDICTVANDLYKKGLIDAGEYIINIDW